VKGLVKGLVWNVLFVSVLAVLLRRVAAAPSLRSHPKETERDQHAPKSGLYDACAGVQDRENNEQAASGKAQKPAKTRALCHSEHLKTGEAYDPKCSVGLRLANV
jgi:hypothetical protein